MNSHLKELNTIRRMLLGHGNILYVFATDRSLRAWQNRWHDTLIKIVSKYEETTKTYYIKEDHSIKLVACHDDHSLEKLLGITLTDYEVSEDDSYAMGPERFYRVLQRLAIARRK